MIRTDTKIYQRILQTKREELLRAHKRRDEIQIERIPDVIDEVQNAAWRDLAISQLDREARRLREIYAALMRIEEASFGICQECGERISPKRLAAVPWAALCLQCQEQEDLRGDVGKQGLRKQLWANAA